MEYWLTDLVLNYKYTQDEKIDHCFAEHYSLLGL